LKGKTAALVIVVAALLAIPYAPLSGAVTSGVPSQAVGLVVTTIPPKLPADGSIYPAIVVSLVDSNGLPSAALSGITVYLTSSQTNIVSVTNEVTIPIGSEYIIANATTTITPGSATITASSHGLSSGFATITTATPSGIPAHLEVFVSPSNLLPNATTGSVRVELVDDAGQPSKAINPVDVLLSSSNLTVANVAQSTLTITQGDIYATGSFTTTGHSGTSQFTAVSTGTGPFTSVSTGDAFVTVVPSTACTTSCKPSELTLKVIPETLPADGQTYSALEVGLATSSGTPAVSSSDTYVTLSSDTPDVVSIENPSIYIPAGTVAILVPLTTSPLEGQATITALPASIGLQSATATVTTKVPAPSKIQAYIAPPSLFPFTSGNNPMLVLQLQDSSGNPARARQYTQVTVTSSNSSMVAGPLTLNISTGGDYTVTYLTATGSGQSVLTASSQDLSSSQVTLNLVKSPLADQLSGYLPQGVLYSNETLQVSLSLRFLGSPVSGAEITWAATGGSVSNVIDTTGPSGVAYTVFTPSDTGAAKVTAEGNSSQTGPFSASYTFAIVQPPKPPPPSFGKTLLGYWYLIAAAVVVVVVAAFYLLRVRRNRQRAEIEAGFEVV